jgi:hypothetical protein
MAKNKNKTYWPHMILGFLIVGVTLGYWTVQHAISLPVQESNDYMLKYQEADLNINEIINAKALFDKNYKIDIVNVKRVEQELENTKRAKSESVVILSKGKNSFFYSITDKNSVFMKDANITFFLTRPHTVKEDILVKNIPVVDGKFKVDNIELTKPGRYTLQLKAKIGKAIGYSEIPAYLKP